MKQVLLIDDALERLAVALEGSSVPMDRALWAGRAIRAAGVAPDLDLALQAVTRVGRSVRSGSGAIDPAMAEKLLDDAVRAVDAAGEKLDASSCLARDDAESLLSLCVALGVDVEEAEEALRVLDEPWNALVAPVVGALDGATAALGTDPCADGFAVALATFPTELPWWLEWIRADLADAWATRATSIEEAGAAIALVREMPAVTPPGWSEWARRLADAGPSGVETGRGAEELFEETSFEHDDGSSANRVLPAHAEVSLTALTTRARGGELAALAAEHAVSDSDCAALVQALGKGSGPALLAAVLFHPGLRPRLPDFVAAARGELAVDRLGTLADAWLEAARDGSLQPEASAMARASSTLVARVRQGLDVGAARPSPTDREGLARHVALGTLHWATFELDALAHGSRLAPRRLVALALALAEIERGGSRADSSTLERLHTRVFRELDIRAVEDAAAGDKALASTADVLRHRGRYHFYAATRGLGADAHLERAASAFEESIALSHRILAPNQTPPQDSDLCKRVARRAASAGAYLCTLRLHERRLGEAWDVVQGALERLEVAQNDDPGVLLERARLLVLAFRAAPDAAMLNAGTKALEAITQRMRDPRTREATSPWLRRLAVRAALEMVGLDELGPTGPWKTVPDLLALARLCVDGRETPELDSLQAIFTRSATVDERIAALTAAQRSARGAGRPLVRRALYQLLQLAVEADKQSSRAEAADQATAVLAALEDLAAGDERIATALKVLALFQSPSVGAEGVGRARECLRAEIERAKDEVDTPSRFASDVWRGDDFAFVP